MNDSDGTRILVVADDEATAALLTAALAAEGAITHTRTLEGATALLRSRPFHVVVADEQLQSGGTGVDVVKNAVHLQPEAIGVVWAMRARVGAIRALLGSADGRVVPKADTATQLVHVVRQGASLARLRTTMRTLKSP